MFLDEDYENEVELCSECDSELHEDDVFLDPQGYPLCRDCWEEVVGYD
jgi:hypothetical protein